MRGYGKNKRFDFFRMIRKPHVPRTRYQVFIQQQFVRCRYIKSTAGTPIVLYNEKCDAVRIEPRTPSLSTCRLCARRSRTLFRPQASGDGTRMQSVLGESRAWCRLFIVGQDQFQTHSSIAVRGARRQLL